MPIDNSFHTFFGIDSWAKVMVWKITESVEMLTENLQLTAKSKLRVASMKSEIHQKGFLCVRKLLLECCILDKDLCYEKSGKPFLKKDYKISISHSHDFVAIALSNVEIGIDIEQNREKIVRIADKFCLSERLFLNANDESYIKNLTTIWAAKESIFKIENQKGISFKNHISINAFQSKTDAVRATLDFKNIKTQYHLKVFPIENYTLVFGIRAEKP